MPFSWLGVVVVVFLFLPMACFRKTRSVASKGLFYSSWLFGITTWFLGATVTFATWGWIGLIIGLLFAGLGVVPIGILAAFISIKSISLGITLIIMSLIVIATRWSSFALIKSIEEE